MKLEFARLFNFRQFYGQQDATFSSFDDLNVTVFHGDNGAGKTSFFSAISWCLYEEGVDDIGELISKRALNDAAIGDEVVTSVQIEFRHEGKTYVANRQLSVEKVKGGYRRKNITFDLTQIKKNGNHVPESNPEGTMNAILPSNVRPYFFFDGEKMDDLTKANSEEVTEAIRNIMRLPALERAKEHLNSIAAEFRREVAKQGSPELERLTEEEESLRDKKEKSLIRKKELEQEINLGKEKLEEVEEKLRNTKETRILQDKRDEINHIIQDLEKQESEFTNDIQKVVNKTYLKYLPSVAEKAIAILDEKREKGEIPSGVREQLVHDLLENLECICGRSFEKNDSSYNNLQALLAKTTSSKLEMEVTKLGGMLAALNSRFENDYNSLNTLVKHRAQTREANDMHYGQLDDIRRKLEGSSEKETANLEKLRTKLEHQYRVSISDQGKVIGTLESLEQHISEMASRREKALAKEKKAQFLSKKEKLAQQAADAVAIIKEEFFENTREEIEKATKEVFSRLAWKNEEHFKDVILDQSFRLEVIDRWGTPTRQELSAGERQILSLSFITALSRLSGEEAPLVMDTPFGRLSGNHLSAVAENLPQLTPQLILFVTDREWDEASRTNLEPRVGIMYRLNFDKATSSTDIEEVDFEWQG
jgi:DNA sulfur modification protein DndD